MATFCLNGQLATVDCAQNPLRSACDPSSTSPLPCSYAGQECGPDHDNVCDHDTLLVCVDGHIMPVNCRELGFDSCHHPPGEPAHCRVLL